MSTPATADLLAEVQALIREREREGVLGLAELIGAAEWADLVPQLEPSEVAVLIQWLSDEEIGEILEVRSAARGTPTTRPKPSTCSRSRTPTRSSSG